MTEPRESIVSILVSWRIEREMARGVTEDRARQIADIEIRQLLERVGGRPWYMPLACTQTKAALDFRDEAIRRAHSSGATYLVIKRSFRVSRGTYYRIINGNRSFSGRKGKAA